MAKAKTKTLNKLSVKENKLGFNYAKLKLSIKEYKKSLDLLQDELKLIFDKSNQNALFFYNDDEIACIQRIIRTGKYFDTTKFKQDCPNVYVKYLVERTTTEYKPVVQDEVKND
jgi:hypothetical protein